MNMAEPSTIKCKICGEGQDPTDFPLTARFDSDQRVCYLCILPTHKYKDDEGNWKKCVIYFINPTTPEKIDVRDIETGTVHTIPVADVKKYDPVKKKKKKKKKYRINNKIHMYKIK